MNQSFAVAEPPHLAFDFVAIDATSALPEDGLKGKGPGEPFVQALSQIGEGFTKLDGHIGQPFYNGGKTIEKAFCHVTDLLDSFFPGNTPKRENTEEGYLSDSDDEMSIEEMQMRFQAFQLWAHGAAWQRRTRKRDAKLAVRVQAWRQRHTARLDSRHCAGLAPLGSVHACCRIEPMRTARESASGGSFFTRHQDMEVVSAHSRDINEGREQRDCGAAQPDANVDAAATHAQ